MVLALARDPQGIANRYCALCVTLSFLEGQFSWRRSCWHPGAPAQAHSTLARLYRAARTGSTGLAQNSYRAF